MQKRARAIIVQDGCLLTIKRVKEKETYWVLPGGGIEEGESNEEALRRECMEELGVVIEVGEFVFEDKYTHEKFGPQVEFFYRCQIVSGDLGTGDGPEYQENNNYEGTHELEWLELDELKKDNIKPVKLKNILEKDQNYL